MCVCVCVLHVFVVYMVCVCGVIQYIISLMMLPRKLQRKGVTISSPSNTKGRHRNAKHKNNH